MARGLGLPAPEAAGPLPDVRPSPALSQIGRTWPTKGRVIGVITGGEDLDAVRSLRSSILEGDMVPLVIAPTGGKLGADDPVTVQADRPALEGVGIPDGAPGVVVGDAAAVLREVVDLLGRHRVWDRFPAHA